MILKYHALVHKGILQWARLSVVTELNFTSVEVRTNFLLDCFSCIYKPQEIQSSFSVFTMLTYNSGEKATHSRPRSNLLYAIQVDSSYLGGTPDDWSEQTGKSFSACQERKSLYRNFNFGISVGDPVSACEHHRIKIFFFDTAQFLDFPHYFSEINS